MFINILGDRSLAGLRIPVRRHLMAAAFAFCAAIVGAPRGNAETQETTDVLDRESFLRAISEVETGSDSRAVGRDGERGMFQFRHQTWQQYTERSFFEAHNPRVSKSVAIKHFDWLMDGFYRNNRTPSTFLMAAAWNAGLTRALSGRMPAATRDYASRVTNIVTAALPTPIPVNQERVFIASSAE